MGAYVASYRTLWNSEFLGFQQHTYVQEKTNHFIANDEKTWKFVDETASPQGGTWSGI